ncbi:MAG: MerR family transcriptional regulator [Anaerolineae bacterium]|nr:MerR family transcriptional regulator [Thermoflexales bacterium]MDW8407236.1 MerR family transcriptional regulator [Anaerolineae bacterium]
MIPDFSPATYSDDPIYNIKAVTQRTGIPAATLRAWERRYKALAPRRTDGNYRLYSERDIATLVWLKSQLDAGLSISRAVALLDRLRVDAEADEQAASSADELAPANSLTAAFSTQPSYVSPSVHPLPLRLRKLDDAKAANCERLTDMLHAALIEMNEQTASAVLTEAFALYSVETICAHVITPCMTAIGQDWFEGKISMAIEHHASAYLMGRLLTLLNAQPRYPGPPVLVGCAPSERHEIGAIMVTLFLRRAGCNALYLGPDIPLVELARAARELKPRVLALSAMMSESAQFLLDLPRYLSRESPHTRLVFGGRAFMINHDLATQFDNAIITTDIAEGLTEIKRLLS